MKTLPFIIQKFVFRPDDTVDLVPIKAGGAAHARIPSYFVMSNAPPNIEDAREASVDDIENATLGVDEIADHLFRLHQDHPNVSPELVIVVHGYNTRRRDVEAWYKGIFSYINHYDPAIAQRDNRVFIGYRWPSETISLGKFGEMVSALRALPPLPKDILTTGLVCAIALFIFQLFLRSETLWGFVLILALTLMMLVGTLMLALVVLRLIVYFRDLYRANNFGVLDLVELLRQLDREVVERKAQAIQQAHPETTNAFEQALAYWQQANIAKVKLSFVGHSMGGFVVTNVVRILSDVFDTRSIKKQPPADLGSVFRLERLLLASPDIPVLTIISSRANFLASSLRRFSESYLFSSEGDIALRIASTTANYIAFPSRTQSRGYRLGNVALRPPGKNIQQFGITNLPFLDQYYPPEIPIEEAIGKDPDRVLDNLFVTYQRFQKQGFVTLASLFEDQSKVDSRLVTVADFFTFLDCTDYQDYCFSAETGERSSKPVGILTKAQRKPALKSFDYLGLTIDYALKKRDVHGGYFQGEFSQSLLYRLAFLGFSTYLQTLHLDPQTGLSQLHQQCEAKQIQCYLSPVRYRVDVQGHDLEATKQALLSAIQKKKAETLKEKL